MTEATGGPALTVRKWWLTLDQASTAPPPPLPAGARIDRVDKPTVAFHRFLFSAVGEEWLWWSRRAMSDDQVAAILHDPRHSTHVLYLDGQPAGFFELDRRPAPDIELAFFGLMPHATGRGLGRSFLEHAIATAFAEAPCRLTVNTCDLDHPAALANYQARGFTIEREAVIEEPDPRARGLIPREAGMHRPFRMPG
jgi:GNAT superfamily N-acetyltransferase